MTAKDIQARVFAALGTNQICDRCGATLETYADKCAAALDERCPGFESIEHTIKICERAAAEARARAAAN